MYARSCNEGTCAAFDDGTGKPATAVSAMALLALLDNVATCEKKDNGHSFSCVRQALVRKSPVGERPLRQINGGTFGRIEDPKIPTGVWADR